MNRTPESEQSTISFTEAHRSFIGVIARKPLRIAIMQAEDTREPIDLQKKESLQVFLDYVDEIRFLEADWAFFLTWQQQKIEFLKFPYIPPLERKWANKKSTGKREQYVAQKIIHPLHKIYMKIERKKPDPNRPWLGELLIKAALDEETTREVYSFLSQFGLNPKQLVKEVYDYLDKKLEK